MPRFSNRPFLATTLSFLSSRPGFPATLRWTRLRVRLSRKERRMKFANATNLNRKSGGAKPSDCLNCQVVNSWKSRQRAASENGERFPLSHEYGDGGGSFRQALPAVLFG
jgi:hypothetical protein